MCEQLCPSIHIDISEGEQLQPADPGDSDPEQPQYRLRQGVPHQRTGGQLPSPGEGERDAQTEGTLTLLSISDSNPHFRARINSHQFFLPMIT